VYLSAFLDRLEGTANAQNQPREWVEGELRDWCITRDMDWGVDYPGDEEGADDLVLYVWVDAPIEYVSATKQYTERVGAETFDWREAWGAPDADGGFEPFAAPETANESGEIVHVIGRDIIQHHTVFWPAMLRGVGYGEPRAVMASGFMTLGGEGFSTSRNRAIWAQEYLDEGFHPDLLRYYLATNGAFQRDVDFSWEKFRERVNTELVGTVGNFLYRSLLFADRNFDGVPDATVSESVRAEIETAVDAVREGVNDYSVRQVGEAVTELARFGNEYIQREEPWNLVDEDETAAAVSSWPARSQCCSSRSRPGRRRRCGTNSTPTAPSTTRRSRTRWSRRRANWASRRSCSRRSRPSASRRWNRSWRIASRPRPKPTSRRETTRRT